MENTVNSEDASGAQHTQENKYTESRRNTANPVWKRNNTLCASTGFKNSSTGIVGKIFTVCIQYNVTIQNSLSSTFKTCKPFITVTGIIPNGINCVNIGRNVTSINNVLYGWNLVLGISDSYVVNKIFRNNIFYKNE